jgi:DNA-binding HxlR family transcriptional regulator
MIVDKNLPACPVATTVGLIGNKWKILILRDVLGGPKRFGELRKSLEGISQKVLTDNLRNMEKDGLLIRKVFPEVPPRVEYSLSEIGETMRPIIKQMEEWGSMYKQIVAKGYR